MTRKLEVERSHRSRRLRLESPVTGMWPLRRIVRHSSKGRIRLLRMAGLGSNGRVGREIGIGSAGDRRPYADLVGHS
jgi:hypothetical protein